MADDTTVLSQPETEQQHEEPQGTVQSDYSSFLGPPSQEADLSADERPAPDAEEAEAEGEPELSGAPEAEEGAEPEAEAQAQPEVEAEAEAEQPPSVEERLKDLTQRESEEYAQRYPSAWKALQDPKTPEDLKHLLLDKIDGDHEIQRRIAAEQQISEEEEPTLEAAEQPQAEGAAQTVDPVQARANYYAQIDNLVKTGFDQQSVKEVGDTLLRMFNVNVKALDDPNVSPEDKAVLRGLVESVQREAPVLSRYMADAVSTVIPHVLPAAMEMAYPGHSEMYERQVYGSTWESVRAQRDQNGRPVFAGLPAFPAFSGTPESQTFSQKLREAAETIPGFDEMVFRDQNGRVLPMREQARMKYTLLARTMSGQRVNPAIVAEAVATGKRLAGRTDQRRQAARVTGAGQPTAHPVTGAGDDEDDPLMANLDKYIASQEQNYREPVRGRRGR
jgi:hypothetical protein